MRERLANVAAGIAISVFVVLIAPFCGFYAHLVWHQLELGWGAIG